MSLRFPPGEKKIIIIISVETRVSGSISQNSEFSQKMTPKSSAYARNTHLKSGQSPVEIIFLQVLLNQPYHTVVVSERMILCTG